MPSPSVQLTTLRPDLASFLEYDLQSDAEGFIATKVFPVIDVASQAGVFGTIPVEELLEQRVTRRSPGSGYARGNFNFTTQSYACVEHGAEEPVDDRQAKMYANYFDSEVIATQRAFSSILRNAEQRVADVVFNTTTFTGAAYTTAVGTAWSNVASSVPITDVDAALKKVWDNSGMWPNALVVNYKVFRNLRRNAQVIDRIQSAGAGDKAKQNDITAGMLAEAFGVEQVLVAGASRNNAKEGQTAAPTQIWSDSFAMVCRIENSKDMAKPCIGRTFHWSEDGSSIGGTVESYRDETVRGNIIRVRHDVAEVLLNRKMGHLLSNIT